MNLYYELLQYPIFSMKEVNGLYTSGRTARMALGKLLKENMVLKIRNGLYTCLSGENGGPVENRFQIFRFVIRVLICHIADMTCKAQGES